MTKDCIAQGAPRPRPISVEEAGKDAGLSRNSAYAAAGRGEIPTIRFGRLLRVPTAVWDKMLELKDR